MRLLIAFCLSAAAACSPSDPFSSLESLYCEQQIHCGWMAASERDACLKSQSRMYADRQQALAAGRISVDDTQIAACAASIDPSSCDYFAPSDACLHAAAPLVPLGGSCDADFECIGGACGCARVCVPESTQCAVPCADGQVCLSGACVERGAEGAACKDSFLNLDCSAGLLCRHQFCVAPPAVGQPCAVDTQIGSGITATIGPSCASYAYCGESSLCVARIALGAACSAVGTCVFGAECVAGTCRVFLEDGQACDPSTPLTGCTLDSFCDDGTHTCQPVWRGEGDACDSTHWCSGDFYCAAGRCAVRPMRGDPCTPNSSDGGDPSQTEPCITPATCDALSHTCIEVC
jgi:hypothetical protein